MGPSCSGADSSQSKRGIAVVLEELRWRGVLSEDGPANLVDVAERVEPDGKLIHVVGLGLRVTDRKARYYGTYHHMSVQHLRRYLDEFAGRHNSRSADTAEQMRRMVRGMVGRRLTWKTLAGTAAAA